jgi:hypothetical protein
MSAEILRKWEREFRRAALSDGLANLRDHLRRLDLPDSPSLLLEGTIHVMRMCFVWAALDGRTKHFDEFLAMQTYDPTRATGARFTATFDIFGRAFARIQLDPILARHRRAQWELPGVVGAQWELRCPLARRDQRFARAFGLGRHTSARSNALRRDP